VKTSGPPEYMQSLIDLMAEKYGPPLIENHDVQSRSGTKFESKIAKWTDLHGTQIVVTTRSQEYLGGDQFYNSLEFGRIYRPESLRLTFGGEVIIESATGAKANAEHQRQILEKGTKGI